MGEKNRTDITGKTDNISMIYETSKQYPNKDMKMSEYLLVNMLNSTFRFKKTYQNEKTEGVPEIVKVVRK